jgi:predicted  nucleic acid-binding Zn-ribbon protein
MSPQQALLDPSEKVTDHQRKFLELYKSISDASKELNPLEKKVLGFEEKLRAGRISRSEAELLKKDMGRVLELYEELDKATKSIHELRKQLPPEALQDEMKAIDSTIADVYSEWTKTFMKKQGSRTDWERSSYDGILGGLVFAEQKLRNFKEGREAEKNAGLPEHLG